MENVVLTRISKLRFGKDGIGRIIFLPNVAITRDAVKEHFAACAKLSKGKKCPVLVDARNVKYANRQARKYFASEEALKITKAAAIVVGSHVTRVIGSFFMGLDKPPYPTKLFTSESKATEWLKRFL